MKQEHKDADPIPHNEAEFVPSASHKEPPALHSDFHPIRIKGEPLSVTVLRDRR
jgi:hypothetical protein